MKLGWLTLSHSPSPTEDYNAINQQLSQACFAETVGFDSVWLTEHNFTGESVYCDPIPFASALAMRTERVRIGFAVIQMTLRHPVRVATQLALLDNLCKGRLDVGVGRGTIFNEYEFVGYGLRSSDGRERMEEAMEILRQAWSGEPVNFDGTFYKLHLPELRPSTYQRPHPPIWHSAVSPPSFEHCGRQGVPIMTLRFAIEPLKQRLALYEAGLRESGKSEIEQNQLRTNAAVWRFVYVAESQAQAEDELSAALLETRQHMKHARNTLNPDDFVVDENLLNPWTNPKTPDSEALQFIMANGTICGTPLHVAEQLAELRDINVKHVLCQMSYGFLSHDRIMRSMQLFGEHVMPTTREAIQ
jgi:alkanesulfonate monooxygenase SsuD/methylene tetrahydromethanopterin reductase-like flavin-dependent oxidoreductase (luciferase family)